MLCNTIIDSFLDFILNMVADVAAALANAVHDALGVRVRELPLTADTLLRAVHAAESV